MRNGGRQILTMGRGGGVERAEDKRVEEGTRDKNRKRMSER